MCIFKEHETRDWSRMGATDARRGGYPANVEKGLRVWPGRGIVEFKFWHQWRVSDLVKEHRFRPTGGAFDLVEEHGLQLYSRSYRYRGLRPLLKNRGYKGFRPWSMRLGFDLVKENYELRLRLRSFRLGQGELRTSTWLEELSTWSKTLGFDLTWRALTY